MSTTWGLYRLCGMGSSPLWPPGVPLSCPLQLLLGTLGTWGHLSLLVPGVVPSLWSFPRLSDALR